MTATEMSAYRGQLQEMYPGCQIKEAPDKNEMVAEITGGLAVAIIERSMPHFHLRTKEIYRVLRGTLYLACGGIGHVLHESESLTIEPGNIHFARAAGEPAWIEVVSEPAWSASDCFVL